MTRSLGVLFCLQVEGEALSVFTNFRTFRGIEIVDHAVVEWEHGGRCADFRSHVADRGHTRAGERLDTRTLVFNYGSSPTLHGEYTCDFQDDVCSHNHVRGIVGKNDMTLRYLWGLSSCQ
jgi:hypothetical protein